MIQYSFNYCTLSYVVNDKTKVYNQYHEYHLNPHYATWHKVLNFMKRRGFDVTVDPDIQKNYKSLSPDRRYGIKQGLEFKSNRYPIGFKLEFFQNETPSENSHGGYYDFDKYIKMSYIMKLRLRNEILKAAGFLEKITGDSAQLSDDQSKSSEEWILNQEKSAHWRKQSVKSLSEMIDKMSDYDIKHNSTDRDGKQIFCGQLKYFYDNRRLQKGVVYHNINNMWWVITNERITPRNIASFYLFDYTPDTQFKQPLTREQQINRLNTELEKASSEQNFERAIVLRDLIKKMNNEKLFNIWSISNNAWWRPGCAGYTSDKTKAGLYLESTILENPNYYNNLKTTKAIAL